MKGAEEGARRGAGGGRGERTGRVLWEDGNLEWIQGAGGVGQESSVLEQLGDLRRGQEPRRHLRRSPRDLTLQPVQGCCRSHAPGLPDLRGLRV
eukprot:757076-Hanusia_phi.AAC.3